MDKKVFKLSKMKALPISGVREVKGKAWVFFNGSKQLLFSKQKKNSFM